MSALPPPPPGFEQLSKADQIRYLQNLWDQISQQPPDLPIPESHLQVVEARLKRYREGPSRQSEDTFEIDPEQESQLLRAIDEANRGELMSASALLKRIRHS